jgi:hypothetical protein
MNYHGWARENKHHLALHIGELPGRKSVVRRAIPQKLQTFTVGRPLGML